jgi:hypothetical protein
MQEEQEGTQEKMRPLVDFLKSRRDLAVQQQLSAGLESFQVDLLRTLAAFMSNCEPGPQHLDELHRFRAQTPQPTLLRLCPLVCFAKRPGREEPGLVTLLFKHPRREGAFVQRLQNEGGVCQRDPLRCGINPKLRPARISAAFLPQTSPRQAGLRSAQSFIEARQTLLPASPRTAAAIPSSAPKCVHTPPIRTLRSRSAFARHGGSSQSV